ncbi:MAG: phosphohistidine phosphatase SixA [Planctomycetes bacterium]|nr:phosphohistidine phosphatase SixA [Planctomycetota bacterium]
MHIYLLRHGIAEDGGPSVPDHARALTEEGWKRLRKAAPAWRRLVPPPDRLWVSPLRRAQETAEVLREAVGFRGELRTDEGLVPHASPNTLLAMLEAESLSRTGAVALVGHEPHLGYLLGLLLTGHPRHPVPLKKGMLVGVETESIASMVGTLRFALGQKLAADLG